MSTLKDLAAESEALDRQVDFIFVHGLNFLSHENHAEKTWTHPDGTLWPRDLLPAQIPTARVMLFGYNAKVAWDASEAGIRHHANDLLDLLDQKRIVRVDCLSQPTLVSYTKCDKAFERPIIFVCHSLGGLVVKQALLTATLNSRFSSIRQSTSAIVFFGVPHRGGNGATLGQILSNTARIVTGSDKNDLVKSLQKGSSFLTHLTADFKHLHEDFDYLTVVETRGLLKAPFRSVVVDRESAELGLAGHREHIVDLDLDHRQICKLTDDKNFSRIARHLKRLVTLAKRKVAETNYGDEMQVTGELQVGYEYEVTMSASPAPFHSVPSLVDPGRFVGHAALLEGLRQWLSDESFILTICGEPGSGKSSAALEFARRQQYNYSTFWFNADSVDSLQESYKRVSLCIAPDEFDNSSRDHHGAVTQWLQSPRNGKWILFYDNVKPKLNMQAILPRQSPWGKILFTSRTKEMTTDEKSIRENIIEMPALTGEDAFTLITALSRDQQVEHSSKSEINDLGCSLRSNPLTIMLACVCLERFQSMPDLLRTCHDSQNNDDLIESWTSELVEDLREEERLLLRLIVLLSRRSPVTIEIINNFQSSLRALRSRPRLSKWLRPANIMSSINTLVSTQLVNRQTSPQGQVFEVPSHVASWIQLELLDHPKDAQETLELGLVVIAYTKDQARSVRSEDIERCIVKTLTSFQSLCSVAAELSILLPGKTLEYLQVAGLHFVGRAIDKGLLLFKRLYWRQWLLSHDMPPPAYLNDQKFDHLAVPLVTWPSWFEEQIGSPPNQLLDNSYHSSVIHQKVTAKLWDILQQVLLVAGIGQAWHGIRDEIFDYVHANLLADAPTGRAAHVIDEIDKGGCDGLAIALRRVVLSEEFEQSATALIDCEAVDEIVRMVCTTSGSFLSTLPDEALSSVIVNAFKNVMNDVFVECCNAMANVLFPVRKMIKTTLDGSLKVPPGGEGARNALNFLISTLGESHIRQRSTMIAQAFSAYLDTVKVWTAGRLCLESAYVMMDGTIEEGAVVDWRWICGLVEMTREAVMPVERVPGQMSQIAGRHMCHYLNEVLECKRAWGAPTPWGEDEQRYEFQNEDAWYETSVLMGAKDNLWVLS